MLCWQPSRRVGKVWETISSPVQTSFTITLLQKPSFSSSLLGFTLTNSSELTRDKFWAQGRKKPLILWVARQQLFPGRRNQLCFYLQLSIMPSRQSLQEKLIFLLSLTGPIHIIYAGFLSGPHFTFRAPWLPIPLHSYNSGGCSLSPMSAHPKLGALTTNLSAPKFH